MVTPLMAHPPSTAFLNPVAIAEKRQVVDVAHHQAVRPVEVRKSARGIDVALIVVRGIERGVARGSGVRRFGVGVRRLEVAVLPAAR